MRQIDGTTCGPAVAVVGSALIDPDYGARLDSDTWFADEQRRIHAMVNRMWPQSLGTTPAGIAQALSVHRPYRWRLFRGRRDSLSDVVSAVRRGRPVAMLIGNVIPRHWVLFIDINADEFSCYEPSSGEVRPCRFDAIRERRLVDLGFPRPFAFVLPKLA